VVEAGYGKAGEVCCSAGYHHDFTSNASKPHAFDFSARVEMCG
jgi:hypothetical protein